MSVLLCCSSLASYAGAIILFLGYRDEGMY